ncbi:MAG: HAMP domain-containing histidine kinase [Firmicutes bacterium]|nr:HAMP domain-containing histidine kinase [Bacillota bacterium]
MFKEKPFWQKWAGTFLLQTVLIAIAAIVLMFAGSVICHLIPWYSPVPLHYRILKWIELNPFTFFFGFMVFCTGLLAIFHFKRFSNAMEQTMDAITGIYENPEKKIVLPDHFREMEVELNEVRIKTHADQQAAKEANQRKNDLIMYMAHDLKTPLTSVIGYLSLVANEPEIPMEVKEKYMKIALKKSHRLEDLINEFFDITRFNFSHMVLEKSTVNLSLMLQQMVSEFVTDFDQKGLTARCDIEADIMAFCDVGKMERVFDNLLKNIVNYSYAGTEISVSLRRSEDEMIEIITENRGRTIAPEMLEHIFDQFFRLDSSRSSQTGGSGLGLAVAKEIIERHDGAISCESHDETIKFCIKLPA